MRCVVALSLALFVACSIDTVDDTDITPEAIWGKYETHFSAQDNVLWRGAQFRVGGPTGTTIRLTGGAYVSVDGARLRVVDGDQNPVNLAGTFYALTSAVAEPPATHTFVWTRGDGQEFTNPVTQARAIAITEPAPNAQVPLTAPLTVAWDEPLGPGETVHVHLATADPHDPGFATAIVNAGDRAVIATDDLMEFLPGPATLYLTRWFSEPVVEGHPREGGRRVSSYDSPKILVELTAD
jgi:hypothetical protein